MNINKHNVAMRWITRRRTNEVAGLYESFPGTFSAYQEALSSGFQGTMEEFIQIQSIPQSDRPFTGKVGGIVEPGVTHYGKAHMDDVLHNIKKGDELGKSVKQIVSKYNKVIGYQAFTNKNRYYISNTEKNALQRVKQYADEFRPPTGGSLRKGITKFTAEAMFQDSDFKEFFKKYLNKGEGYVKDFKGNADKLSLDDLKKEWDKLKPLDKRTIIRKDPPGPWTTFKAGTKVSFLSEVAEHLPYSERTLQDYLVSSKRTLPKNITENLKVFYKITESRAVVDQLKELNLLPENYETVKRGEKYTWKKLTDADKEKLKNVKRSMNIELDPTKRGTVAKAAKKTLLPEQRSINMARKLLITETNRQLENLLKYKPHQFRLFIANNPILKEIVETEFRAGDAVKTPINEITDNELFKKVQFAEDHIKDFNKAKINAWGKVLVGEGIENPENLRTTLRHLNYPLKSKVAEFVERNRGSKDIKIQNQIKNWKSFFNRTGQAFLTGEFEKGTIHGLTGNISLEKQFKNLGLNVTKILDASGNEELKAKVLKVAGCGDYKTGGRIGFARGDPFVCLKNKLENNPKGTLSKIFDGVPEIRAPLAQTLGPDGWRFLGVDYSDLSRMTKGPVASLLRGVAGTSARYSPTFRGIKMDPVKALAKTGRVIFDPIEVGTLPLWLMGEGVYQYFDSLKDLERALNTNKNIPGLAEQLGMSVQSLKNAIKEKYRQGALNVESGLEETMAFEPKHQKDVTAFDRKIISLFDRGIHPKTQEQKMTDEAFIKGDTFGKITGGEFLRDYRESKEKEYERRLKQEGPYKQYLKRGDPLAEGLEKYDQYIPYEDLRPDEDPLPEGGFYEGGRVPFGKGGMGRRAFLGWLAGAIGSIAGLKSGLIKFGAGKGKGTLAVKAGDHIIQSTPGMPDWYIPLVNRIVKEGDDITAKLGTVEREIVHTKKLGKGEFADEVTVYQDMNTGNVRVEYNSRHSMGEGYEPVHLEYRAGEVIEEGKHAGKKTKPEFEASEVEPVGHTHGPDDYSIDWDGENVVGNVDDLMSDTSKLKQFATKKKPTMGEIVETSKKRKAVQKVHENESDYIVSKQGDYIDYDDYLPGIDELD